MNEQEKPTQSIKIDISGDLSGQMAVGSDITMVQSEGKNEQSPMDWIVSSVPVADRRQLIKISRFLNTYFDAGELKRFCFELGVDYENLPGAVKGDKALALATHFYRRGRFPQLVKACYQKRPPP